MLLVVVVVVVVVVVSAGCGGRGYPLLFTTTSIHCLNVMKLLMNGSRLLQQRSLRRITCETISRTSSRTTTTSIAVVDEWCIR